MKSLLRSSLLLCLFLAIPVESGAQTPVGALAIDARQGHRYGWAVDYDTPAAAQASALQECGSGCSVVLTFSRCAAFAADQDADSTAVGWSESYASAAGARQAALAECSSRGGGSGCIVRVWGCNGPVVEDGLGLDRAARRRIQSALRSAGFDPGAADGLFGPRTRAAIRRWQSFRGGRPTGYLDAAALEALQTAGASVPPAAARAPAGTAELEALFWQSIADSTNPAEYEAYLSQFPDGVFRPLARARLAAFSSPARPSAVGPPPAGVPGSPTSGSPVTDASAPAFAPASAAEARRRPGEVFLDCTGCPQMVVLPGGRLAMGRYEVTVGEYRAFASATGGGAGGGCLTFGADGSWRDPGFPQTDRHPVTCMSWDDTQAYLSWLSRTTGATYRLPTRAEWERAAPGSVAGCPAASLGDNTGTCPVGASVPNAAGLFDMEGNVSERTDDCLRGDCARRMVLGASWTYGSEFLRREARGRTVARSFSSGFRVVRTLD